MVALAPGGRMRRGIPLHFLSFAIAAESSQRPSRRWKLPEFRSGPPGVRLGGPPGARLRGPPGARLGGRLLLIFRDNSLFRDNFHRAPDDADRMNERF